MLKIESHRKYEIYPKGVFKILQKLKTGWDKIHVLTCFDLIKSIPRRNPAVIKRAECYVKYEFYVSFICLNQQ